MDTPSAKSKEGAKASTPRGVRTRTAPNAQSSQTTRPPLPAGGNSAAPETPRRRAIPSGATPRASASRSRSAGGNAGSTDRPAAPAAAAADTAPPPTPRGGAAKRTAATSKPAASTTGATSAAASRKRQTSSPGDPPRKPRVSSASAAPRAADGPRTGPSGSTRSDGADESQRKSRSSSPSQAGRSKAADDSDTTAVPPARGRTSKPTQPAASAKNGTARGAKNGVSVPGSAVARDASSLPDSDLDGSEPSPPVSSQAKNGAALPKAGQSEPGVKAGGILPDGIAGRVSQDDALLALAGGGTGTAGIDPQIVASLLGRLNRIESQLSTQWTQETKLRVEEHGSLPSQSGQSGGDYTPSRSDADTDAPPAPDTAAAGGRGTQRGRPAGRAVPGAPRAVRSEGKGLRDGTDAESSDTDTPSGWREHAVMLEQRMLEVQTQCDTSVQELQARLREALGDLADAEKELELAHSLRSRAEASAAAAPPQGSAVLTPRHVRELAEPMAAAAAELEAIERMLDNALAPKLALLAEVTAERDAQRRELSSLRTQVAAAEAKVRGASAAAQEARAEDKAQLRAASVEISGLMAQAQSAEVDAEQLRSALAAAQARESALQALVDGQEVGENLIAYDVHKAVLLENEALQKQITQLKSDLEMLYMDEQFVTGAAGAMDATMHATIANNATIMSTTNRVAALIAGGASGDPFKTQSGQGGHHRQRSSHSLANYALRPTGAHRTAGSPTRSNGSRPASPQRSGEVGDDSGARLEEGASGSADAFSGSMMQTVDKVAALTGLAARERGPVKRSGSDAEHEKDKERERELTATVSKQATLLVEKDAMIATLKADLGTARAMHQAAVEAAERATSEAVVSAQAEEVPEESETGTVASMDSMAKQANAFKVAMRHMEENMGWEELPVPDNYKQALEQILMLQMANTKLKDNAADLQVLVDANDALAEEPSSSGVEKEKEERGGSGGGEATAKSPGASTALPPRAPGGEGARPARVQDAALRTVALEQSLTEAKQTIREMQSMRMLADAMSTVQAMEAGKNPGGTPSSAAGGVISPKENPLSPSLMSPRAPGNGNGDTGLPADLQVEVFKDLVLRELSDRVVEWQEAHADVSTQLEDTEGRLTLLTAQHDRMTLLVKSMMEQSEAASKASSSRLRGSAITPHAGGAGGTSKMQNRIQGIFGRMRGSRTMTGL